MTPLLEDRGIFCQPIPPAGFRDDFDTNTIATYGTPTSGGNDPTWTGTTWKSNQATNTRTAPTAWGNASDQAILRIRARNLGAVTQFAIGFTSTSSPNANAGFTALCFDGKVQITYTHYLAGSDIFTIPGWASGAQTYYVMEFKRNGNSYRVAIRDGADTADLNSFVGSIPSGNQAAFGAGVTLKPMILLIRQSSQDSEADWWTFKP